MDHELKIMISRLFATSSIFIFNLSVLIKSRWCSQMINRKDSQTSDSCHHHQSKNRKVHEWRCVFLSFPLVKRIAVSAVYVACHLCSVVKDEGPLEDKEVCNNSDSMEEKWGWRTSTKLVFGVFHLPDFPSLPI